VQFDAVFPAIHMQDVDLGLCLRRDIEILAIRIRRACRCGMIDGCKTAVGPAYPQFPAFQLIEGLWRGYFVQQLQVDIQDGGRFRGFVPDQVAPPDFLEKRGGGLRGF
jgi:hypothetical protein